MERARRLATVAASADAGATAEPTGDSAEGDEGLWCTTVRVTVGEVTAPGPAAEGDVGFAIMADTFENGRVGAILGSLGGTYVLRLTCAQSP
mmetsp:Transcript_102670/g.319254  ORF Transcript_102670/g.319254 Transcript_102670/m.319254 type:complete len:92 (-) Transcript_102670:18-293(-)